LKPQKTTAINDKLIKIILPNEIEQKKPKMADKLFRVTSIENCSSGSKKNIFIVKKSIPGIKGVEPIQLILKINALRLSYTPN
jgi:hypothetical protein